MELELHQLELRYEGLRKRHPPQERQLLASLAEVGQQLPIVVVNEAARFIVIDGYKRVRALKRLARDTVRGTRWEMAELEALLLERGLRGASEDALDQAWLLAELQERFGLSLEELARRFERSKSWVSRRLGLIQALPASIHQQVRAGVLPAHAAMKYLVPLARANADAAAPLAAAIAPWKPTSRQVGALYAGWQSGTQRTRELILESPQIYLQAQSSQSPPAASPAQRWLNDLGALSGIARRARRPLEQGLLQELLGTERTEVEQAFARTKADVDRLFTRFALESGHAG
jgi:ParB-like chromosome segregation protein Spo0J